jgi:hypothetical protein
MNGDSRPDTIKDFPGTTMDRAGGHWPNRLTTMIMLGASGTTTPETVDIPAIEESVERKYNILAQGIEHGTWHTHHDSFLFLAKDRAVPATLRFYRTQCDALGAGQDQLNGIDRLIERVERFQLLHPELVKVADVDPEYAVRITGPNSA